MKHQLRTTWIVISISFIVCTIGFFAFAITAQNATRDLNISWRDGSESNGHISVCVGKDLFIIERHSNMYSVTKTIENGENAYIYQSKNRIEHLSSGLDLTFAEYLARNSSSIVSIGYDGSNYCKIVVPFSIEQISSIQQANEYIVLAINDSSRIASNFRSNFHIVIMTRTGEIIDRDAIETSSYILKNHDIALSVYTIGNVMMYCMHKTDSSSEDQYGLFDLAGSRNSLDDQMINDNALRLAEMNNVNNSLTFYNEGNIYSEVLVTESNDMIDKWWIDSSDISEYVESTYGVKNTLKMGFIEKVYTNEGIMYIWYHNDTARYLIAADIEKGTFKNIECILPLNVNVIGYTNKKVLYIQKKTIYSVDSQSHAIHSVLEVNYGARFRISTIEISGDYIIVEYIISNNLFWNKMHTSVIQK